MGHIISKIPMDPQFARIIYFGYALNLFEEAIIAAAIINTKNPIVCVQDKAIEGFIQKLRYSDYLGDSDVIAGVRAYFYWKEQKKALQLNGEDEFQWTKNNGLSLFTLSKKKFFSSLFIY